MSSTINRRFLDVSLSVLGVANEPPATPAPVNGTQYIVGDTPAGAFASATAGSLARYDGYDKKWKFTKPAVGQMELLNVATRELMAWDGTAWTAIASLGAGDGVAGEPPVLGIVPTGATLPATAATGDLFLNTADGKLYTATAENTWNAGAALSNGARYASSTDRNIYEAADGAVTGEKPADGALFLNKADEGVYVYHGEDDKFILVSNEPGEITFTETHVLTATEAAAKEFNLTKDVAAGHEANVILSVGGVMQVPGVDFTVNGKKVSWGDKDLKDIDLAEGDVFIVSYPTAA